MMKCDSCEVEYPDFFFEGDADWLQGKDHLSGLHHVCKRCRDVTIECTSCHLPYPAVGRYFYKRFGRMGRPVGKHGLGKVCKSCCSIRAHDSRLKRLAERRIHEEA